MRVAYSKAIGDALKEEMRRDEKVLMIGEDIGEFGSIFGITRGMLEVIDPRTLAPLDTGTICNSIRKTHRAAVVEESNKTAGIGAELAAKFQEDLYYGLDAPICRIAALDVPMPYNLAMEHYSIPTVERIMASIRGMFN